jgi:hypothetical protein
MVTMTSKETIESGWNMIYNWGTITSAGPRPPTVETNPVQIYSSSVERHISRRQIFLTQRSNHWTSIWSSISYFICQHGLPVCLIDMLEASSCSICYLEFSAIATLEDMSIQERGGAVLFAKFPHTQQVMRCVPPLSSGRAVRRMPSRLDSRWHSGTLTDSPDAAEERTSEVLTCKNNRGRA